MCSDVNVGKRVSDRDELVAGQKEQTIVMYSGNPGTNIKSGYL